MPPFFCLALILPLFVGALVAAPATANGSAAYSEPIAQEETADQQTIAVPEGDVRALIDAIEEANDEPEEAVIEVSGTYTLLSDADDRISFAAEGYSRFPPD